MKGRPPKPVEQRRAEGNPGKRPLPEPVIVSGRTVTAVPPVTMTDRDERECWEMMVPGMVDLGLVDRVDIPVLTLMCRQWARAQAAARVIAEFGMYGTGSMGQVKEADWVKTERDATTRFLSIAEHFAATPVARARLGLAQLEAHNALEKLKEAMGGAGAELIDERDADLTVIDGDAEDDEVQDADVVGDIAELLADNAPELVED